MGSDGSGVFVFDAAVCADAEPAKRTANNRVINVLIKF
jgi:hypothetical protein